MSRHLIAVVAGILFGLGLSISQMINPSKVLAFLDVSGAWDPSLLVVMASALTVAGIGYRVVALAKKPVLMPLFESPKNTRVDSSLMVGSAIFGIGWGLAGYCPGPVITSLVLGLWEPFVFIVFMLLGSYSYHLLFLR